MSAVCYSKRLAALYTVISACLVAVLVPHTLHAQTYSSVVLGSNPAAYWRFEDTSSADGATAADATGNHPGTYVGGPTLITPPHSGSAPTFDGTGQHVAISALSDLGSSLGEALTFEFLFHSTSTARGRVFGAFNTGNNTTIAFTTNTGATYVNGQPEVGMTSLYVRPEGNDPLEAAFSTDQVNIYDGQWHHIVWSLDDIATKGLGTVAGAPNDTSAYRLTIDNIEIELTYAGVFDQERTFADFQHPFRLGAAGRDAINFAQDPWRPFMGELDEFAIYDRLLTSTEISDHFAAWQTNLLLPGDFNNDKIVNDLDFFILSDNLAAHLDRVVTFEDGDFNFDGKVDLDDFALFKASYPHLVLGSVQVPEPAAIVMAGLLLTLPLTRRMWR